MRRRTLILTKHSGRRKQLSSKTTSGQSLEAQIQRLITQKKYSTAIRKLQQGLKREPGQVLTVSESDIWLLQGQDEIEQSRYSQAEKAFRKVLEIEPRESAYYGLAQALIFQKKPAVALALFQAAFEDKTLPKSLGGSYLKLLFLDDKAEVAEALIKTQTKRFYAPHLHWAKGAIALKAGNPKAALPHFKKIGRPSSPGDRPTLWETFAHQQAGDWSFARKGLPLSAMPFGGSSFSARLPKHPATQQLMMSQIAHADLTPSDFFDLDQPALPAREAVLILELVQLIREENFHDAAHLFVDLPDAAKAAYPTLKTLERPLMILAGEQARQQQEFSCTTYFWKTASRRHDLEPNLALNLYKALEVTKDYGEALQQLNRIMAWVKQRAQQSPKDWPKARHDSTLAKLLCWTTDCQMMAGRYSAAAKSLQKAEKLAPAHPDVIGRKGLQAASTGDEQGAILLLTRALEAGCRFHEVYGTLLELLDNDIEAIKPLRRKFGQYFGDAGAMTEVEIPIWVEALTFQNYGLLEKTVRNHLRSQKKPSPTLKAYEIFLDAADDEPSSGQKITLNQEKAVPQWNALLASQTSVEQVEMIQAIYLIIQQHAKRNKKGMAKLQSSYLNKIIELSSQQLPGADVVHLMMMGLRSPQSEKLDEVAVSLLNRSMYPEQVLAQAQLALYHFGVPHALRSLLEAQLKQSPQHPQLLLANATLFPRHSSQYETFYERGFEIARRLQDADALKAFREEEWFASNDRARQIVGSRINRLSSPSERDMLDMIKELAQAAFGSEVPPEILAQLVPQLMAEMAGELEEDDDFEEDFDNFFMPQPPPKRGKKKSKKRKSFFQF